MDKRQTLQVHRMERVLNSQQISHITYIYCGCTYIYAYQYTLCIVKLLYMVSMVDIRTSLFIGPTSLQAVSRRDSTSAYRCTQYTMQYDMIRGHLGNWSRESQKLTVIKRFGEVSLSCFHTSHSAHKFQRGGVILATGGECPLPSLPT